MKREIRCNSSSRPLLSTANFPILGILMALAITVFVAGCGGGGGGGGSSTGPGGGNTATVSGTLVDKTTGQPLPGVVVTVGSSNLTATSSNTGAFSIPGVSTGAQTLTFSSNGSSIGSDSITVSAPSTALGNVDVNTEGNPPPSPPI
jgi:hypothetical protein